MARGGSTGSLGRCGQPTDKNDQALLENYFGGSGLSVSSRSQC